MARPVPQSNLLATLSITLKNALHDSCSTNMQRKKERKKLLWEARLPNWHELNYKNILVVT